MFCHAAEKIIVRFIQTISNRKRKAVVAVLYSQTIISRFGVPTGNIHEKGPRRNLILDATPKNFLGGSKGLEYS